MSITKASIITIGEEILSGLVTDTNSAWMARHLHEMGIDVNFKLSVQDNQSEIVQAIGLAFEKSDLILMTGGLGPTKDDVTKTALMEYFDRNAQFDERTYRRIVKIMASYGKEPTQAHKDQSFMPSGTELLLNEMGTAPGMVLEKDGKILVSLPGVPYEMKHLFSDRLLPILADKFELEPIHHIIIMTCGEGESRIAATIEDIEEGLPKGITIAYLPGIAQVRLRISGRGSDIVKVREQMESVRVKIKERLGDYIYGYDNTQLEEAVGALLLKENSTVSTAESCTGGYLAHKITSISGSSSYFQGSIIAYANEIKENLLGVDPEILNEYGAVSEQTIIAMAKGVREKLNTKYGMATSGIAGPTGGTPDKPVGTIWIACADEQRVVTKKLQLGKDRLRNIQYTTVLCLNMLRFFIMESEL